MLDVHCVAGFSFRTICTATAQLDGRGKIVVAGTTNRGPFLLAIVGGTGEFSGARGHVFVEKTATDGDGGLTFFLK